MAPGFVLAPIATLPYLYSDQPPELHHLAVWRICNRVCRLGCRWEYSTFLPVISILRATRPRICKVERHVCRTNRSLQTTPLVLPRARFASTSRMELFAAARIELPSMERHNWWARRLRRK